MDRSPSSPTANALRTLEQIQALPGITAGALASRLGVSERAVRRYVAVLREAGVAVESRRGPYGGYQVAPSSMSTPVLFSSAEAVGLVMAALDGHHATADPDDPVGSGLEKLIRSLPRTIGSQAAAMRRHALAAPDRRAVRPDPATTNAVVESLARRQAARLIYRTESGRQIETVVDPWSIVVRHGRWYLLCRAHHVDASRVYRIDRIQQIDVLNRPAEVPDDLNPVTSVEEHLATGWRFTTEVVFAAPIDEVAPLVSRPMGHLEAIDDNRCRLVGTTGNPQAYAAEWLAAIPHPFTVIGGPELRNAVAGVAGRMCAAVSDDVQSI